VFGKGVRIMERLYFELKNQRIYYFVPPAILFILLPLTVLAAIKSGAGFSEFATISQLLIPGFAPWWPLFILKEYLNSPGKELLFVHKFSNKDSLFFRMIILWALFVLHVAIVFFYFSFLFDFVWFLFTAVVIQSLFMTALAYFLSLLFQNTFVPLIINFAYISIFILVLFYSPLSIFINYPLYNAGSLGKSIVVTSIAFTLFYGGYQMEKRLFKNSI